MSLKPTKVDSAWEKLGFELDATGDHVRAKLWVGGQLVVRTKRSHGARGLKGNIPLLIRKQMHLSADEFRDAIQCPLQANGYLEILRDKGHLEDLTEP